MSSLVAFVDTKTFKYFTASVRALIYLGATHLNIRSFDDIDKNSKFKTREQQNNKIQVIGRLAPSLFSDLFEKFQKSGVSKRRELAPMLLSNYTLRMSLYSQERSSTIHAYENLLHLFCREDIADLMRMSLIEATSVNYINSPHSPLDYMSSQGAPILLEFF
jgi:hypothetical protein